jgi:hypothetical protein
LLITGSVISGNTTYGNGGGIVTYGTSSITNVAIIGNSASYTPDYPYNYNRGGGVWNSGTLTMTNATISGNSADTGGGVFNYATGTLSINNVTITHNSASAGDGINNYYYGTARVSNSILAANDGPDCAGALESQGHTLLGDTSGCTFTGAAGDIVGDASNSVDPQLGLLSLNGGSTPNHPPLAGSPAIDAGDNASCAPTDQRGLVRPEGSACDIGAIEWLASPALQVESITASAPITITAGDSLTLTFALSNTNTSNRLTGVTLDVPLPSGLQLAGAPPSRH